MASVEKFEDVAVSNILRHSERTIEHSSNPDIDQEKSDFNYKLSPKRNMSDFDYYKQRKSELYVYGRKDVKTLAGWVVTLPKNAPPEKSEAFFKETYKFLESRYGKRNVISAVVHADESGQPHLHFNFIPVSYDFRNEREKVCANEVLDRSELRSFHGQLQQHLDDAGLSEFRVYTGVTARNGRNYTVDELKRGITYQHDVTIERGRW